jgi:hypothetical protein
MGEQPGPVEEELERALVSMRVGFLSGSSQIAAGINSLDEALVDAPENERERVRVAVTQIVNTQARLTAMVESLPTAAWDRFKVMVSVVKAQQAALDQLGELMQAHVLPRQIDNLSITPFPDGPPQPVPFPDDGPAPAPFADDLPPSTFPETFSDEPAAPRGESFMRAQQGLQALDARRTHEVRRGRRSPASDDDDPRSLFARVRDRTAGYRGLAAMLTTAAVLALVPGETRVRLQDLTAKVVAMLAPAADTQPPAGGSPTSVGSQSPPPASPPAGPARRPAEAAPRVAEAPPPQERAPKPPVVAVAPDLTERVERPLPAPVAPRAQKPVARPAPPPPPPPAEVTALSPRPEPPATGLQADEKEPAGPA